MNDASGEPGETPEYLALPTHAGLCVGGPIGSLATRGISMDVANLINNLSVEEESPKGISEGGIAGASVDEAQLGSVDVASATNAEKRTLKRGTAAVRKRGEPERPG